VRDVNPAESDQLLTAAGGYYWLSAIHALNAEKTLKEVEEDRAAYEDEWERDEDYGESFTSSISQFMT
jgi:hypothetical protein